MALGTSVFSGDWAAHHTPVVNSEMTGRVKITRTVSEGSWNPDTNDYDGEQTETLYLGRASIERIARPRRGAFVADSADNQVTQLMIPTSPALNEADPAPVNLRWQSNDMVTILRCAEMPMMEGEKVFVRGWFGATGDWAYTLHADFNAKQGGA